MKQAYRNRIIIVYLGILVMIGGLSTPPSQSVLADDNDRFGYVDGQVLIHWDEEATLEAVLEDVDDAIVLKEISPIRVAVLYLEHKKALEAVAEIKAISGIIYAEPNFTLSASDTIPNDTDFNLQYGLISIRAPQGWDISIGATDTVIAVLDTGVDLDHPDLTSKIVPGYDFVNGDADPDDDNGHGTMVAGVAAAVSDNNLGIAGTSWGARVMPVKVLNAGAGGSYANVAAGVVWAVDNGADVINMSLGGATFSNTLQLALEYAADHDVVMTAAAGNGGFNLILFPARAPEVMAVGAVDASNQHYLPSNTGVQLSIVAPGVDIYSTWNDGGYNTLSGTSFSTPFVSGLAAILVGLQPGSQPSQIYGYIEDTALDLGDPDWDLLYGYGLVQMDAAMLLAQPAPEPGRHSMRGQVFPIAEAPSLRIVKTVDADVTALGQPIRWTITVHNESDSRIEDIVIIDPVDRMLDILEIEDHGQYVTVQDQTITWTIPDLDAGKAAFISLETVSNSNAVPMTLCNSAHVWDMVSQACIQLFPAELPPTGGRPIQMTDSVALPYGLSFLMGFVITVWMVRKRVRDAGKL